jgi:hypothetical protein
MGFQNMDSAESIDGDVIVVEMFGADDMGCEYWYDDRGIPVL